MKILKLRKRIDIDKAIGDFHISTFHYSSCENDKHKQWTELEFWHEPDCENCALFWEVRGYDDCDCGCCMAEPGEECPRISAICMLPNWSKKILLKHKNRKIEKAFRKTYSRK